MESFTRMRFRVALWWLALLGACLGLVVFLVSDVALGRSLFTGKLTGETMTGLDVLLLGLYETAERIEDAIPNVRHGYYPDPEIWLSVSTVCALVVPLFLRLRPSPRTRRILGVLTIAVLFPTILATIGASRDVRQEFSPALFGWAGGVLLMCTVPWLRRHDQIVAMKAWDERPARPQGPLPKLEELSAPLRGLVRHTRSVRTSLDVLSGLDNGTMSLLADWQQRVEQCDPVDADLLSDLGLSSQAVLDIVCDDDKTQVEALLEIDKALAHFEGTLADYRAFGFR